MRKTRVVKKIEGKNEVFLDFKSALAKLKIERNINRPIGSISDEMGVSRNAVLTYEQRAPTVVKIIYHFLKDNDLKFEDLVKECIE